MKTVASRRYEWVGHCDDCGKGCYTTRSGARAAAKKVGKELRAYQCPVNQWVWHFGHLPKSVLRGRITRGQLYPRA